MPRSPMSSEEEMAQSFSDSVSSESDSSPDEPPRLDRPTSARLDNSLRDTMLICVVIPDLQQSVRSHSHTRTYKHSCFTPGCWVMWIFQNYIITVNCFLLTVSAFSRVWRAVWVLVDLKKMGTYATGRGNKYF